MKLSVVTPAFNEADNLDVLYARLCDAMTRAGTEWEWLVVDDHSTDATFDVLLRLAKTDPRVRGIRLARNCGSHLAIACGLRHARGDVAAVLAGDLQDPPDIVVPMLEAWRRGADVVWAVRRRHSGRRRDASFSGLYYWIMRSAIGLTALPYGSDSLLLDRVVIDAFSQCDERHVSVFALVASLGFRQARVEYDKQPRAAGRSGWTLERKFKLVADSVTAFSSRPIQWITGAGAVVALAGALISLGGLLSLSRSGLMLVAGLVILIGGIQLAAIGTVGEYVWRALEGARRRPAYFIERSTEPMAGARTAQR